MNYEWGHGVDEFTIEAKAWGCFGCCCILFVLEAWWEGIVSDLLKGSGWGLAKGG
jgi:hypothetical protein